MKFEVYRYAADGRGGEVGDGRIIATGTLDECREAIRAAGPVGILGRRWAGTGDDSEAYHESRREGCGGWAIRPAEEAVVDPEDAVVYRVCVDYEFGPEEWWAQARYDMENEECPAGIVPILSVTGIDEVLCSPVEAGEIRRWAEGLPGWGDGGEHDYHPLMFHRQVVSG